MTHGNAMQDMYTFVVEGEKGGGTKDSRNLLHEPEVLSPPAGKRLQKQVKAIHLTLSLHLLYRPNNFFKWICAFINVNIR